MATFAILVTHSPIDSQDAYAAWRFALAAIENGHTVNGIFFYSSGVHNASELPVLMSDEFDLHAAWKALHEEYAVPLYACISAANKRGILSEAESREAGKATFNVRAPFNITGLGDFFSMLHASERLVQF